jgi:Glycine-zipper domain
MRGVGSSVALIGVLGVAACAVQPPQGPSFAAMPGNGKTFEQFQGDDARCRGVALGANGGVTSAQAANQSGVGSAVAGTALGAAAGALLGSTGGAVGAGAAIGAGAGLLAGSAIGAGNAQASSASLQRNYDNTYAQCMVAAGESVPTYGGPPYAAYPPYPAYGYAYPPPVVGYAYGPPVAFGFGWGWGGGWRRRYW